MAQEIVSRGGDRSPTTPSSASAATPGPRPKAVAPRRDDAPLVIGRPGASLQTPRPLAHVLLCVIAAFFVCFFAWASWARLDEVTRGDGKVIPSSHVQVVQNLEGGIVAAILVREGEIVEPGQVLLRIDDIRARSDLREGRKRHLALVGALSRLRAEIDGLGLTFPDEVHSDAPEVARNELDLFEARREALESNLGILGEQAEQRERELEELQGRLEHVERSHALALEELAITQPLADSHVVPKLDLLRLKRQINDLEGERDSTRLALARSEAARREAYQRIDEEQLRFRAEAQRELNSVQAEAEALGAALATETDRLARTEVRSPVRGTVQRLLITTIGGVVQPGADLVEIVPLEDPLLVEARSDPPTSPSCARARRRWSRSPPTISPSTAASTARSRTSAPTPSPTRRARASFGSGCGPTRAPWSRTASRCRSFRA